MTLPNIEIVNNTTSAISFTKDIAGSPSTISKDYISNLSNLTYIQTSCSGSPYFKQVCYYAFQVASNATGRGILTSESDFLSSTLIIWAGNRMSIHWLLNTSTGVLTNPDIGENVSPPFNVNYQTTNGVYTITCSPIDPMLLGSDPITGN